MLKALRTIRLDPSDAFVFPRAAEPGEWAVAGTFLFWDAPVEKLTGKARAAFRSGLLGINGFGWSTLALVVEVRLEEREAAIATLAQRLMTECGAPDLASARLAAQSEIMAGMLLAEPPVGTLVAVHRSFEDGAIRERFRTLLPGVDENHSRVFSFIEEPDAPEERLDLLALQGNREAHE